MQKDTEKGAIKFAVLIAIIISIALIVAALPISQMVTEKYTLYGVDTEDSGFALTYQETKIKGQHRIDVKITVKNNNPTNATANATVQLLYSSGNIIVIDSVEMDQTQSTGNLTSGGSKTLTYVFTGNNLVSQYDSTLIIIKRTA